jgi:hypothetical protein
VLLQNEVLYKAYEKLHSHSKHSKYQQQQHQEMPMAGSSFI